MREFKFRGWDATGQKGWVYGDLVHNKDVYLRDRVMVGGYEVVPESIGLWTGKKDSKGKEIYESDIIRISYNGKKVFDASVVWHNNYSAFMLDEGDGCYSLLPSEELDDIETEVIGNTFQNKTVEQ